MLQLGLVVFRPTVKELLNIEYIFKKIKNILKLTQVIVKKLLMSDIS